MKTVDRYMSIIATTVMGGSAAALLVSVVPHASNAPAAIVCGVIFGFSAGVLINALR